MSTTTEADESPASEPSTDIDTEPDTERTTHTVGGEDGTDDSVPSKSLLIRRSVVRQSPDSEVVPPHDTRTSQGDVNSLFDDDGNLTHDLDTDYNSTLQQRQRAALDADASTDDEFDPRPDADTESDACPECGSENISSYQQQTGGADEGMTSFNKCGKCGNSWRGGYGG